MFNPHQFVYLHDSKEKQCKIAMIILCPAQGPWASSLNMRKHIKSTKTYRDWQCFTYICRLKLERMKGIDRFSCKNCNETVKIYITQSWSNSQNFVFCICNIVPPRETRPHSHIIFTMSIHVFGISGVLFRGVGTMSHKIIPFWLII